LTCQRRVVRVDQCHLRAEVFHKLWKVVMDEHEAPHALVRGWVTFYLLDSKWRWSWRWFAGGVIGIARNFDHLSDGHAVG